MPHLIVSEPGRVAVAIPLRDGFRVGRHDQNDLVLHDHRVSRQHARFDRAEHGWQITDLGSTHGMLVNGAKATTKQLQDKDHIQMGSVLLTYYQEDAPSPLIHHHVTATLPLDHWDGADRRLRLIYDLARAIGAIDDTDELLTRILEAILDVLGCERALAGLCDHPRGPIQRFLRTRSSSPQRDIVVSRALLEAMLARREGVIIQNAEGGNAPKTVVREHILCAMGAPLQTATRLFGFLYVDDRRQAERFTPQDLDFLTSIAYLTAAALEGAERYQRARALAEAFGADGPTAEIIGKSPAVERLKAQIHKYGAASSANVLIQGQSGTGKELIARALHTASPRAPHPFVTLNCAAIPETMIESELFGYEKGAFTGAVKDKRGKFAIADKGTLFLDEIGDLNLAAQAKVLRAVQEGEIQPLGSEKTMRVDVRIVAATHKDLRKEIAEKRFREDLYYRLAVVEIESPPLSARGDDIALLAEAFLRSSASNMGKRLNGFSSPALAALSRYAWPGNVRELRNEVERAAINAEGTIVELGDLSPRVQGGAPAAAAPAAPRGAGEGTLAERFAALEPTEKQLVEDALAQAKGNLSEAARLLGITRIMMKRRVDRFGLKVRDE